MHGTSGECSDAGCAASTPGPWGIRLLKGRSSWGCPAVPSSSSSGSSRCLRSGAEPSSGSAAAASEQLVCCTLPAEVNYKTPLPLPFAGFTEDQLNRAEDIISSLQVFFGIPCAPEPISQPIMITDTSCGQSVIIVGCSMLRSPRFEAEFLLLETADPSRPPRCTTSSGTRRPPTSSSPRGAARRRRTRTQPASPGLAPRLCGLLLPAPPPAAAPHALGRVNSGLRAGGALQGNQQGH